VITAMDIELKHIRYFLAVANELSFSRAAEQLYISQSSLTRAVAAMEQIMGVQLMRRTTRKVELTHEGEHIKTELERFLRDLDNILAYSSASPVLRVGFNWVLPDVWAQQAISMFERGTKMQVKLVRRDEPHAGLGSGDADIAVKRGEARIPRMRTVTLFREHRVAVMRSDFPLARRPSIHWEEIANCPLVVNAVSGTTEPGQWRPGRQPYIAARCGNFDEWLETVALGRGVGITTAAVARRVVHPAVRFVRVEGAPLVPVYLAYPQQGTHPLVRRFIRAAQKAAAALREAAPGKGTA
jgi:DNA-binding transcriptional LysR family regulator